MPRRIFLLLLIAVLLLQSIDALAAEPLFRLDVAGRTLEGTPLALTDDKVLLLTRDGRLAEFPSQEATNYSRVPGGFHSYSLAKIRGQLLREFVHSCDVS